MKVKMKKTLFSVAVLCSVLFFASSLAAQTASEPRNPNSHKKTVAAFAKAGFNAQKTRRPIPDFAAPIANVSFEQAVSLADYKGKVVFLNIWATWCGPCRSEMPSMEKLYQRYKAKGLEILAVNIEEEKDEVEAFMKKVGLSFPAVLDSDGKIAAQYGVTGIPTTYILDREGKIVLRVVGSIEWDTAEMFAAFETLLAE